MLILKSKTERTEWLLDRASQDPFFASIADDLQKFGFEIHYPLFGGGGDYRPLAVETNIPVNDEFLEAFRDQIAGGEFKARLSLSTRFGKNHMVHTFLHELTHFYQDLYGLFLTPLEHGTIIQPDLRSHIEITLLCEAMATTEAIRASLRLKDQGHSEAWNGAFWSLNWHGLAKAYTKAISLGTKEEEAAEACFNAWYESGQRKYYEKRAFETYKNHNQDYRAVNLAELVTLLPEEARPAYLKNPQNKLEIEYKSTDNRNWQDITIGSPPYIWREHISNETPQA